MSDRTRSFDSAERFFAALTTYVVAHRRSFALMLLAVTIGAVLLFPRLELDTSNETWFVEDDPTLAVLDRFEQLFRNDDFVYVLYGTEDFFRPEHVALLGRLAADLEQNVPYVGDITWLGNVEFIEGREDSVDIHELMGTHDLTAEELTRLKATAMAEPLYIRTLISPDAKVAGLLIEMESYPDDHVDPRKEIAPAVRAVISRPEYRDLELYAIGMPIFDYDLDEITVRETLTFVGLSLIIQAGILAWVGRGLLGVAVPLLVVATTVTWAFGAIVLYGITLSIFVTMLPILLICVGIGDSIHMIAEYHDTVDRGIAPGEALIAAMASVGLPCFLTSLTTAAGFLAFATTRIKPFREMGYYAATGVAFALLCSYLIVPIAYSGRRRAAGTEDSANSARRSPVRRNDIFDRVLRAIAAAVTTHPRKIVGAFVTVSIVAILGLVRVEIETATVGMLSPEVPTRRAYDYADTTMGNSMSIEIMLDAGVEGGIHDPDFLRRMDGLDGYIKAHPLASTTSSILDIHKQMRRAFHENRAEYYTIPESRDEASQYLLLYEMAGGAEKAELTTFEYDVARLTARTRALDTRDVTRFVQDIEVFVAANFDPTTTVKLTGMLMQLDAMTDLIGEGQRRSFITAAIAITAIMVIVLRSVRLGLISMIPNVFPVISTLGLMGFCGIYLGVGLMTISAIIIGVAVDDTIHFFLRFRREFAKSNHYAEAIHATLATAGRPIVFTTATLTLGFAALVLSDVNQFVLFGALAGFAFTMALAADLLFAPALVVLLKPLGPEEERSIRDAD